MFKLTQAAAGIAAALLAFSAQAADFQIRGVIDLGLTVTHAKHGDTTLSMTPDNYIGSGFDFLGEEKLSGTTKVGFALRIVSTRIPALSRLRTSFSITSPSSTLRGRTV